jgi:hypothetical protein
MNPEKDWAEKAVEEIMDGLFQHLTFTGPSPHAVGLRDSAEFIASAVEIIKRRAREALESERKKMGFTENVKAIYEIKGME